MSTVLITGATRGIGKAVAKRAAAEGDHVVVTGRDRARVDSVVSEIADQGGGVDGFVLDVTDRASVEHAAIDFASKFEALDILINNAGILPEAASPSSVEVLDPEMMRESVETNLFGPANVIAAFLPALRQSTRGRIVNVSTRMASLQDQLDPDSPFFGMSVPAYQASKAALNCVTIGLSKALADSTVTVAAVCPGFVQTDLTPMNQDNAPLSPQDAASTILEVARNSEYSSGTFTDAQGEVPW